MTTCVLSKLPPETIVEAKVGTRGCYQSIEVPVAEARAAALASAESVRADYVRWAADRGSPISVLAGSWEPWQFVQEDAVARVPITVGGVTTEVRLVLEACPAPHTTNDGRQVVADDIRQPWTATRVEIASITADGDWTSMSPKAFDDALGVLAQIAALLEATRPGPSVPEPAAEPVSPADVRLFLALGAIQGGDSELLDRVKAAHTDPTEIPRFRRLADGGSTAEDRAALDRVAAHLAQLAEVRPCRP